MNIGLNKASSCSLVRHEPLAGRFVASPKLATVCILLIGVHRRARGESSHKIRGKLQLARGCVELAPFSIRRLAPCTSVRPDVVLRYSLRLPPQDPPTRKWCIVVGRSHRPLVPLQCCVVVRIYQLLALATGQRDVAGWFSPTTPRKLKPESSRRTAAARGLRLLFRRYRRHGVSRVVDTAGQQGR